MGTVLDLPGKSCQASQEPSPLAYAVFVADCWGKCALIHTKCDGDVLGDSISIEPEESANGYYKNNWLRIELLKGAHMFTITTYLYDEYGKLVDSSCTMNTIQRKKRHIYNFCFAIDKKSERYILKTAIVYDGVEREFVYRFNAPYQ